MFKAKLQWVINMSSPIDNVVIIGGGFSGTALAVQLLRRAPQLSVTVLDSSRVPARGLAYGTEHQCHLLNVPAGGMSALPDQPDHFLHWAEKNHALPATSRCFLPRAVYGKYLESLLEDARRSERFEWIRAEAQSIRHEKDGYVVELSSGQSLTASRVVLALGNFPPGNPGIGAAKPGKRYVTQVWAPGVLDDLAKDSSVLLVGTGLTSVDVAIALQSKGFTGKIHILSRRALLPQRHAPASVWKSFEQENLPKTVLGLLQLVRTEVEQASAAGSNWRAVIDSLRPHTQYIWQSLPVKERRKFLRHVRAYWEVHRHRIAPQIADLLAEMTQTGQIQVYSGRIKQYRETEDAAEVTFRARGTGNVQTLRVDRVINCTGPETDYRRINNPLLNSVISQGLARQDWLALGLETDIHGALVDSAGSVSKSLYAIGPARKASLWESTAVPELRVQAADLADHLLGIGPDGKGSVPREILVSK